MNLNSADLSEISLFDNLIMLRADGDTPESGVDPSAGARSEKFRNPNARGVLYRPSSIEDLKQRASSAGARFSEVFSTK